MASLARTATIVDESIYSLSPSTTNVAPEKGKTQESKEKPVLTTYATVSSSTSPSTASLPTPVTAKQRLASFWRGKLSVDHLKQDIHPGHATFLLWCFCFMSGLMNSVPFTATMLWCGFQTGNTVQLAIAVGRFFSSTNTDFSFQTADRQALVSLLSYLAGGYLARFGDRIGSNKRAWLVLGTFLQALLTMAAALTVWKSGQPSIAEERGEDPWASILCFISLAFASASMGLQGVMARKMTSHFGATVVLTTLWSELIGDPDLWKPRYVKSRDHRLLAVLAFFLGGMIGRGIINQTSSASLFGIATGFRVLIAVFWWFVPAR